MVSFNHSFFTPNLEHNVFSVEVGSTTSNEYHPSQKWLSEFQSEETTIHPLQPLKLGTHILTQYTGRMKVVLVEHRKV